MKRIVLMVIATTLTVGFLLAKPPPVRAQTACGERAKIVAYLSANYSEQPVAMGLTEAGSVVEVLVSPKGTWTILVTVPAGLTCMVTSGVSWESLNLGQPLNEGPQI